MTDIEPHRAAIDPSIPYSKTETEAKTDSMATNSVPNGIHQEYIAIAPALQLPRSAVEKKGKGTSLDGSNLDKGQQGEQKELGNNLENGQNDVTSHAEILRATFGSLNVDVPESFLRTMALDSYNAAAGITPLDRFLTSPGCMAVSVRGLAKSTHTMDIEDEDLTCGATISIQAA